MNKKTISKSCCENPKVPVNREKYAFVFDKYGMYYLLRCQLRSRVISHKSTLKPKNCKVHAEPFKKKEKKWFSRFAGSLYLHSAQHCFTISQTEPRIGGAETSLAPQQKCVCTVSSYCFCRTLAGTTAQWAPVQCSVCGAHTRTHTQTRAQTHTTLAGWRRLFLLCSHGSSGGVGGTRLGVGILDRFSFMKSPRTIWLMLGPVSGDRSKGRVLSHGAPGF